jgi:hypothetical protein
MDLAQQKEQFSFAYLRAVAAVAGYTLYRPEVDDDSVDWGLAARGEAGTPRRPRVEVQLKCTARDVLDGDRIRFPLKRKNYDDLRDDNSLVPRVLVVVLVPPSPADWLRHSEEEMAMRHAAYWLSLRGRPDVPSEETVTVYLPRAQQLTPAALVQMMKRINDGGAP